MLKRTMICASIICFAQSLTLSAAQAQEDGSVSLENSSPSSQSENPVLNQVAQIDQKPGSESVEFESSDSESIDSDSIDSETFDSDSDSDTGPGPANKPKSPGNVDISPAVQFGGGTNAVAPPSVPVDKPAVAPVTGKTVPSKPVVETTIDQTDIDAPISAAQSDDISEQEKSTLNEQVQSLKQQVLELNKDLFILEEELLFPANTQVAVFVSMNVGDFFQLDAVKLTIDEKVVTNYLYTSKQVDALYRGGVQRLYLGNLKTGAHEVVAVFTGRGPKNRDYRRAATLTFEKTSQAKQIELKIVDSTATQQPEFVVKEW